VAVSRTSIIGPYFFRENGPTATVNADRYVTAVLRGHFLPGVRRRRRINLNTVWFRQDGATCRTSTATMAFLRQRFPGRPIAWGLGGLLVTTFYEAT